MSSSAFEFGQKIAMSVKAAGGIGELGQQAGKAIGSMFKTPQILKSPSRVAQETMLSARRPLKEPGFTFDVADDGLVGKTVAPGRGMLRNPGASDISTNFIPRRAALKRVGAEAARNQVLDQSVAGGIAAGGAGYAMGRGQGALKPPAEPNIFEEMEQNQPAGAQNQPPR